MRFLIRADASCDIGTGHIRRCLVLAKVLRDQGHSITFMCRDDLVSHMSGFIKKCGFPVLRADVDINEVFDWVIVDHYDLDATWERKARYYAKKIMVIDDMARVHDCDLLLDQNDDDASRYASCGAYTSLLLGPGYALLREEFLHARSRVKQRKGSVFNILVNFGGLPFSDYYVGVLERLSWFKGAIMVIQGQYDAFVQKKCEGISSCRYYAEVKDMTPFLLEADIAIGAGGSSCWERACLGVPSLVVSLADNQIPLAVSLEKRGAGKYLGHGLESLKSLKRDVESIDLSSLSKNCIACVDGRGAHRVVERIVQIS